MSRTVLWYSELGMHDVETVGGKNASLGEMIRNLAASGVSVPNGFATTAEAYREFLAFENLAGRIQDLLAGLDVDDVRKLASSGLVASSPLSMEAAEPPLAAPVPLPPSAKLVGEASELMFGNLAEMRDALKRRLGAPRVGA